jgi:hypothetical protein
MSLDGRKCQITVRRLEKALQLGYPRSTPDYEKGFRLEGDVNRVFQALHGLSMEPGFMLDQVYRCEGLGAWPIVYARKATDPPFESATAYDEARSGRGNSPRFEVEMATPPVSASFQNEVLDRRHAGNIDEYIRDRKGRKGREFLRHVRTDGSPEGFFELVVLDIMGSGFCLVGHGHYRDDRVVCASSGLPRRRWFREAHDKYAVPSRILRMAEDLDLVPRVELGADVVRVAVVTFGKWRGFSRETYSLRREFPHEVLHVKEEVLIPYNCGVWY